MSVGVINLTLNYLVKERVLKILNAKRGSPKKRKQKYRPRPLMRESAKSWLPLNHEDPRRKVRSPENDERIAFCVSEDSLRPLGDAEWQCRKPLKRPSLVGRL